MTTYSMDTLLLTIHHNRPTFYLKYTIPIAYIINNIYNKYKITTVMSTQYYTYDKRMAGAHAAELLYWEQPTSTKRGKLAL